MTGHAFRLLEMQQVRRFIEEYASLLEEYGIDDFPAHTFYDEWERAFWGWKMLNAASPPPELAVGMPDEWKPLCDLRTGSGFLVMVGTVGHVLTLSGFDQACVEFVARAKQLGYDTGELAMLAYDYVKSIATLHGQEDSYVR